MPKPTKPKPRAKPKPKPKPTNNLVFRRPRVKAPASPSDDDRRRCELRRAVEEREERWRLAAELGEW